MLTRRTVLQTGAAATALTAPFVRGAHAAGKLSFGVWDHWVPGASEALNKLCNEWAAKEKVDLNVDLITSNGDKDLLTLMAEGAGQGRPRHHGRCAPGTSSAQADNFVPVDDMVHPADQGVRHDRSQAAEYLGKIDGHWMAVPTSYGSSALPPCARIDYMKQYVGLDVQKMYPAGLRPTRSSPRPGTWDAFLTAAEKCSKAGHPFGLRAQHLHRRDQHGRVRCSHSYGAHLVDAEGNITVKTDATRQALECFKQLANPRRRAFMPRTTRRTTRR